MWVWIVAFAFVVAVFCGSLREGLTELPAGYTLYKADTQFEGKYTSPANPVSNASECMTACSGLPGCQGIGSDSVSNCRLYTEFSETSVPLAGYSTYKYSEPTTSSVPDKPVFRRFIKKKNNKPKHVS